MLVVATAASVVASQALISGVFSIMRQVCVCVAINQVSTGHRNSITSRNPAVLGMRIACKLCDLTVQDRRQRRYRLLKSCHR